MHEDLYIDLNILEAESAEEYHARAGEYLSSHQLLDFMACPRLYDKRRQGQIADADTPSLLIGRAAHVRILEGRNAYEAQFALGGPINPTTNKPFDSKSKAFTEWAAAQGKPVLSYKNVEMIEQMAKGVSMNKEAVSLLIDGCVERVIRTIYCDTPCQARLDQVHPHRGIVDLKTTGNLRSFENECKRKRHRYHSQLAFYQAVLEQVIGEAVPAYLIGIEKAEPFRCGVWRLSDNTLAIARQENEAAIKRLLRAQETGDFPTGYEEIRLLDVS